MGATRLTDRVLDALDDAPTGQVEMRDGFPDFGGRVASVQWIAAQAGVSDSSALRAVKNLAEAGLVRIVDGLDPAIRRRRLFVSAVLS